MRIFLIRPLTSHFSLSHCHFLECFFKAGSVAEVLEVLDLIVGDHNTFINNYGAFTDSFDLLHDVGGEQHGLLFAEA